MYELYVIGTRDVCEATRRDEHKGSYYANPACDVPTTDARLLSEFPAYCRFG